MTSITYNNAVLNFNQIIYLDITNGIDTNTGIKTNPVKTVAKAITLINQDNTCICFLTGGTYPVSTLASTINISYTLTYMPDPSVIGSVIMLLNTTYSAALVMPKLNTFIGIVFQRSNAGDLRTYEYFYNGTVFNLEFDNCVFDAGPITPTGYPIFTGNSLTCTITKLNYVNCVFVPLFSYTNTNGASLQGNYINCIHRTLAFTVSSYNVSGLNGYSNPQKTEGIPLRKVGIGTGTNPDGTIADLGIYGGTYAWKWNAAPTIQLSLGGGNVDGGTRYTTPNGTVINQSGTTYVNGSLYYLEYAFNNSSDYDASNTYDYFLSNASPDNLVIDLRTLNLSRITRIDVVPRGRSDNYTGYSIESSSDNSTWTNVVSYNACLSDAIGAVHSSLMNIDVPKYIRISLTKSNGAWGVSAQEIRIFYMGFLLTTGISLNKSIDYIAIGNTDTLIPTMTPNNTNPSVAWSSSNSTVATVNSTTGLITGIAIGNTIITATTIDGTNLSATCTINVMYPLQNSLLSSITSTHSNDVIISGAITDPNPASTLQYQILVNGTQIYPSSGYTDLVSSPVSINYIVSNPLLIVGSNNISVNYKNNFGIANSKSFTITKINTNPLVNMQLTNGYLTATISDPEIDNVQYKILINGIQKYPTFGYSNLISTPYNMDYFINRSDILINVSNTITIQLMDSFGGAYSQTITFTGGYIGLVFTDINGAFYTSDIGVLLKYLDFGKGVNSVILGQTTDAKQVFFKNQYGYTIQNVVVTIKNSLPNVIAQLSLTNSPFVPVSTLTYNKVYDINSTDSFYVRLVTTLSTSSTSGTIGISIAATR